jgi:hypothetical protein
MSECCTFQPPHYPLAAAAVRPSRSHVPASIHAHTHKHTGALSSERASCLPMIYWRVFCVRYHSRNILSPRLGATSTAQAPFLLTRSMHQVSMPCACVEPLCIMRERSKFIYFTALCACARGTPYKLLTDAFLNNSLRVIITGDR